MITIGRYSFGEKRLAEIKGEGRSLTEAYPNIPAEVLAELEKATQDAGFKKPTKKKPKKSKS